MSSINEKKILETAIDTLRKQTGLFTESLSPIAKQSQWADYKLALRPEKEIQPKNYLAVVKKDINSAKIGEIAVETLKTTDKIVLITEYVSKPQAMKLRELDIPFFDTAGNAYFNEPGFYVFVTGQKAKTNRERVPASFSSARHEAAVCFFD